MQYKIYPPEKLKTTIELPASKSISNRVLILNALSLNTNPVENLSDCEDTQVIIDAFSKIENMITELQKKNNKFVWSRNGWNHFRNLRSY